MIKTFALILYVTNPTGDASTFAIDYDLSASDCGALYAEWNATLDEHSTVRCMPQGSAD